ncbi:hypothetical protein P7K49_009332 [Saguinus oedipus]|uniref:Uncharacterized protein n=1 Tax=Saguinus oedipus TaxID=9490 RepID=A0ABQ9VJM4_SAGOE|nr:hypothetical protein P7K49_009332 [Saguinus oedipus]
MLDHRVRPGPVPRGQERRLNNTSEEEDYGEGLPEKEEGIICYICYCPEDDSYLEGVGCNGDKYLVHGTHPVDTNTCQGLPHNMPLNWTSEELCSH